MFAINTTCFLWQGEFKIRIVASGLEQYELEFYEMSKIWYETGKTRITFVLIVHKWIPEAANLCIEEHIAIFRRVFNFPLEVAYYSNIDDNRN